jgi:cobalt-zinc-cadmium efflux system outer membrane protein
VSFAEDHNAPPSPNSEEFQFLAERSHDPGLTMEEVLQHALDCHPLLHARAQEVEAARGRLVTAGLLPNPQWVMDTETPVDGDEGTVLSSRLTFALPTGHKRRWRMAAAEAGIARSRAALARETEVILAEVADAAIEVLYLQERAPLQSELSRLANKTAETVEGRFQSGSVPYPATIRSRLDAAETELERLAILGDLKQAQVRLNRAAGFPPAPLRPLRGELDFQAVPTIPLERLLAEAERCRPELAESRAALLESQRLLAAATAEARPDIVLGPRVREDLGPSGDRVGARFSVDVPVFDRNQGRIAERTALIHTQCAMFEVTQINTLNDVAATYLQVLDTQTWLEFHHRQVQPIVTQTESTLQAPDVTPLLLPDQVSELFEQLGRMRVEQLELRYLHTRLRTRLEILVGCPLDALQDVSPLPQRSPN